MFVYEKRLQYPINVKTPNPKLANYIISQYGGPDGIGLRNLLRTFPPIKPDQTSDVRTHKQRTGSELK